MFFSCVCVCDSERQGNSLQLQLEQTSPPPSHSSATVNSSGSGSRERAAGSARQSRSKSTQQRRATPYQHRSRDGHLPLRHHYPAASYDDYRYYYGAQTYAGMPDCDYRPDTGPISTAGAGLPVPYDYPLDEDGDDYVVSGGARKSLSRDRSACAVHSSVIVRRYDPNSSRTGWQPANSSCCKVGPAGPPPPPPGGGSGDVRAGGYGGQNGVGEEYVLVNGGTGVAGYTSVIVATPGASLTH